ncbi:MAG: hypothetical protein NWQ21_05240, partial [Desulfobacterales bacterium]|nr:hypothetical protein [Desulfobacterales bacterium]
MNRGIFFALIRLFSASLRRGWALMRCPPTVSRGVIAYRSEKVRLFLDYLPESKQAAIVVRMYPKYRFNLDRRSGKDRRS